MGSGPDPVTLHPQRPDGGLHDFVKRVHVGVCESRDVVESHAVVVCPEDISGESDPSLGKAYDAHVRMLGLSDVVRSAAETRLVCLREFDVDRELGSRAPPDIPIRYATPIVVPKN
jgi:hypothetical protein